MALKKGPCCRLRYGRSRCGQSSSRRKEVHEDSRTTKTSNDSSSKTQSVIVLQAVKVECVKLVGEEQNEVLAFGLLEKVQLEAICENNISVATGYYYSLPIPCTLIAIASATIKYELSVWHHCWFSDEGYRCVQTPCLPPKVASISRTNRSRSSTQALERIPRQEIKQRPLSP